MFDTMNSPNRNLAIVKVGKDLIVVTEPRISARITALAPSYFCLIVLMHLAHTHVSHKVRPPGTGTPHPVL